MYSRDILIQDDLNTRNLSEIDGGQDTTVLTMPSLKDNFDSCHNINTAFQQTTLNDTQVYIEKTTMVSPELLAHVVNETSRVLPCFTLLQPAAAIYSTAASCEQLHTQQSQALLPSLASFIGYLIHRSHTRTSTIFGFLVFLKRLQGSLWKVAKGGMPCSSHCIFAATMIIASKALHDTSPKNKHWVRYVKYFDLEDINLMERQILQILDYRLIISPEELVKVYHEFKMAAFNSPLVLADETRFASIQLTDDIQQQQQQQSHQRMSYVRHLHQFNRDSTLQQHHEEYRKGKFIIRKPYIPTIDASAPQQQQQQQQRQQCQKDVDAPYVASVSSNAQALSNNKLGGSVLSLLTFLPTAISCTSNTSTASMTSQDNHLAPSLSSTSLSSSLSDETLATLTDEESMIEGKNSYLPPAVASEILRHAL